MKTPQEITYDAGRHALDQQHAFVAGIRQSTSTLLAAHALVASILGSAAIRAHGLHGSDWVALATLVVALGIAAALLVPWRLEFGIDARSLYAQLSRPGTRPAARLSQRDSCTRSSGAAMRQMSGACPRSRRCSAC